MSFRTYTIDEVELPSVTSVLGILDKSEALLPWAVRQCTKFIRENKGDRETYPTLDRLLTSAENEWRNVRDEAGETGSQAHSIIESHIKGKAVPTEISPAYGAFKQWEDLHCVSWLKSEMTVQDLSEGYAGTLDAIAIFEGKNYVIDFKTSSGFYDTFGMQIAAYANAARKMGHDIEGCGVLRLDKKTGLPEWRDYSHRMDRDYNAFLHLLDYWYSAAERRLKKNPRTAMGRIPRRERVKQFDQRTIQQNRYYRALCRIIMSHTGYTMEQVHDFFRGLFLYESIIIGKTEMKSLLSTTDQDRKGMTDFIDNMRQWQQENEPTWYLPTVEEWEVWDREQIAQAFKTEA